jgi:hypothetical protein
MRAAMIRLPTFFFILLAAAHAADDAAKKPAGAPDAKTAPAAAEEKKEWVLFDGKSLDDWEMVDIGASGAVELEGGLMIINQGDSISGAVYKKAATLPMIDYEITLEAKRLEGVDFFCGLTFPVGDAKTCATLVCGGWGGAVTGISNIDNLDASENGTSTFQKYEDDKWYAVRLRVTKANLSVWIDGKHVINEDIMGKKIAVRPGPVENYLPLSLTTYATTAAVRNIKLISIKPDKTAP